ncbi:MAG: hypothetical protein KGQ37_05645 [Hyphomicrobiales bacterium]|nr:hypothetical protein [Hyphomicrobiales bacterium]
MATSSSRTVILGSVGIAVLALAGGGTLGVIGAKSRISAMMAAVPGLKVGAWSIDPASMQVKISHISFNKPGMDFSADSLTIPMSLGNLWAMASARADGGTASANNISIVTPGFTLKVPHITATNASFDDAALAKMLDVKDATPASQRIAALNAGTLSVPVMIFSQKLPVSSSVTTLNNIEMSNVVKGVIGHATIGKTTVEIMADPKDGASVHGTESVASMSFDQLSLPGYLRWMLDTRKDDNEPRQLALADQKVNGIAMKFTESLPKGTFSADVTVKDGEVQNARLRAMKVPGINIASMLPHPVPGQPADTEAAQRALEIEADLLGSTSFDHFTAHDISVTITHPPKADVTSVPIVVSLDALTMAETATATAPPSGFSLGISHLKSDLDQLPATPGLTKFKTNFYSKIDLSLSNSIDWDMSKGAIELKDLTLSGAGAGAATMSFKLIDVGNTLLSTKPADIEAAMVTAKATAVHLHLDNQGVVQKILAVEAASASQTPAQYTQQLIAGAGTIIPAMLGQSAASQSIGAAIAKFLGDPKNLDISATSAEGIGAPEIMAAKMAGPAAIVAKLHITASADQ